MSSIYIPCRSCAKWSLVELPEGGAMKLKEKCECGHTWWDYQKVTSVRTFKNQKYKK